MSGQLTVLLMVGRHSFSTICVAKHAEYWCDKGYVLPGVFPLAMQLTETENLIKQRYPMAWAERKAEADKKEAHLRELLAIQRMDRNSTFRSI